MANPHYTYDPTTDTITIDGVTYAGAVIREVGHAEMGGAFNHIAKELISGYSPEREAEALRLRWGDPQNEEGDQ